MADPVAVAIEFNPNDLRSFLAALKRFDPTLATSTRRRLRQAGNEAVAEMRGTILSMPVTGAKDYGVRSGIAGSLRTQVMTSKRANGVRIAGSGASLGGRSAMLKALNKTSFRHPVFGHSEVWVEQQGRPYFGEVLHRHMPQVRQAILKAVEDACEAVKR